MEKISKKRSFNKRAFASMVMLITGIILPISGIKNHNLQLEPMTSERHFWMSVHNMSGLLFIIFAILHISYNWRTLLHYVTKLKKISLSKEMVAAFVLVVFVVGLFSLHAFHV